MKSVMIGLVLAAMAAGAGRANAQTAVHLTGREIDNAVQRSLDRPEADQPLQKVDIGDRLNLGISVVHRARTGGRQLGPAAEHSAVTEIFHFIAGTGTIITGGSLQSPQPEAQDPLSGPTVLGSGIADGAARGVGPGDVVVIPPNTPVQFTAVNSSELVYLVIRVEPGKAPSSPPPQ